MAVKFAAKSSAPKAATVEGAVSKINVRQALDAFVADRSRFVRETGSLPDSKMPAELQKALGEIAQGFGFEYDAAKHSTIYVVVKEDGTKSSYGPILKTVGESCAIVWSQEVIQLPGDMKLNTKKAMLSPGDNSVELIADVGGYGMPIRVGLNEDYKGDNYGDAKLQLMLEENKECAALANFLELHFGSLSWADLADGTAVMLLQVEKKTSQKGKDYYSAIVERDGLYYRAYCPGSNEQWEGVELPEDGIKLVKQEGKVIGPNGTEYQMGSKFGKLAALGVGVFRVTGFAQKPDGKFGPEVNITVETPSGDLTVNANKSLESLLWGQPDNAISSQRPAVLFVDVIVPGAKVKVVARLFTAEDMADPEFAEMIPAKDLDAIKAVLGGGAEADEDYSF